MTRAMIIVQRWVVSLGWQYDKGYPESNEDQALKRAHELEAEHIPAQVYRRTPEGPEIIYESSKS